MKTEALAFIKQTLENGGINYEFGEWNSPVSYPYFVGEYEESEPMDESGLQETSFLLTGFTRNSWYELETAKNDIERLFSKTTGRTAMLDSSGVAVFYNQALIVPTGDEELKRIEIRLTIKEWSVN